MKFRQPSGAPEQASAASPCSGRALVQVQPGIAYEATPFAGTDWDPMGQSPDETARLTPEVTIHTRAVTHEIQATQRRA
jgi:hypothetical protein